MHKGGRYEKNNQNQLGDFLKSPLRTHHQLQFNFSLIYIF